MPIAIRSTQPKDILRISIFIACSWLITACTPWANPEQPVISAYQPFEINQKIGQSFQARFDGLERVDVFLNPITAGEGSIELRLYGDDEKRKVLAHSSLPTNELGSAGTYDFPVVIQSDSSQRAYYLELELVGSGQVEVGIAPGSAYLNGALYHGDIPQDAQLAFNLAYDPFWLTTGMFSEILNWTWLTILAAILLLIPGWTITRLLSSRWTPPDWAHWVSISAGVGLALYSILLLWTDAFGFHLGKFYAWLPVVLGLVYLLISSSRTAIRLFIRPKGLKTDSKPRHTWRAWPRNSLPELQRPDYVLMLVLFVILATRWWAIRGQVAPLWGDAVQHTTIAQLILDHGGLFETWEPYAPYNSLTVQFGFPVIAATYAWLTGMDVAAATLAVGQIVNALAALCLYPLAVLLAGGNRWCGITAVAIAGLFSPLPAQFANWGRYAQLAGQAILPVAIYLVWNVLEAKSGHSPYKLRSGLVAGRLIILAGFALVGMTLSYYRMPFYAGTFLLAFLLGWGLHQWKCRLHDWLAVLVGVFLIGGVAIGLVAPWIPRVLGGNLAAAVEAGVTIGSPLQRVLEDYRAWLQLTSYVPGWLLLLCVVALGWSVVRRQRQLAALGLWIALLASLVALSLLRLPATNLMQNFAVLIALYIPVSLVVGLLLGELVRQIELWRPPSGGTLLGIILPILTLLGGWNQRAILQPQVYSLVTYPDYRAMGWIQEHIPQEALFLVESFSIYGGSSAVGSDAGWWIPLLARRQTTMPPQYALMNENPIEPDYSRKVVDLVTLLEENPPDTKEGLRAICDWGVTHVYIGQTQGLTGSGARQLFSPQKLSYNPSFRPIYHRDRVWIFELVPGACEANR